MPTRLLFADPPSAADALTFAQRATRLGDGAIRLRAADGVLSLSSAPLAPESLLDDTPTVIGMRFVRVDPELECDLVIDAAMLTADEHAAAALRLPDTAVTAPWAGISAPRGGWMPGGEITASALATRAQWGIAAVAEAVPTDAGDDVVRTIRSHVWGEPDSELDDLPLGVAFAAFALGFIAGEERAVVRRNGPWTRVSLQRGHVLTRSTVRTGLTAVRTTGG